LIKTLSLPNTSIDKGFSKEKTLCITLLIKPICTHDM